MLDYTPQPPDDDRPVTEPLVTDKATRKTSRAGLRVILGVLIAAVAVIAVGLIALGGGGFDGTTIAIPTTQVAEVASDTPADTPEPSETPDGGTHTLRHAD